MPEWLQDPGTLRTLEALALVAIAFLAMWWSRPRVDPQPAPARERRRLQLVDRDGRPIGIARTVAIAPPTDRRSSRPAGGSS